MPFLLSDLQRSASPLVLQSGVRSTLQEEANNGGVPEGGGQVERSLLLHVHLVDLCTRLQQHLGHLHGPPLRSEKQRRETVVPRLVRVCAVLEEDLGDLWEPLPCSLDQWRGSRIGSRPVDLDATPVGRPLQQPPRGVRLPVVRGAPQRSQFVPHPPNSAGARRHEAVHLEPRVRDVQVPELRQGRQDINPALQAKTRLDIQGDELSQVPQPLQIHAPVQKEFTELAKVLQRVEGARKPHAITHIEDFKGGAETSERLQRCSRDGLVARQVDVLESRAPTQGVLQKEAPLR